MRLASGASRFDLATVGQSSGLSDLSGWEDAYDTWPASFDRAAFDDGAMVCEAVTPDGYLNPTPPPSTLVGHWLIFRETGLSDNFEVSVRWVVSGTASNWLNQVSPVAFVDVDAADVEQMGVLPIWDVSQPATYMQNAFRNTLAEAYDPALYNKIGDTGVNEGFVPVIPGDNWVTMRCEAGTLTYSWNGRRRDVPVPVPAWAAGRTKMGVHVIGTDYVVGSTYPLGGTVLAPSPAIIADWTVRPLT